MNRFDRQKNEDIAALYSGPRASRKPGRALSQLHFRVEIYECFLPRKHAGYQRWIKSECVTRGKEGLVWSHYKKSFLFIQLLILAVIVAVYQAAEHRLAVTAFFFVIMQLSSVIGSMWAMRLRRKLEQHP
jgi:hypothetical protein